MSMEEVLSIVCNEDDDDISNCFIKPSGGAATPAVPAHQLEVVNTMTASPTAVQEASRSIRAAFIAGKDPAEILQFARSLPPLMWLDYFIKLSPKEVEIKGSFDVRKMVAQMGPIQRKPEVL